MKINGEDLEIYRNFECFGRESKKWMQKCILLLPQIEERSIWEKKGFSSIYEFAAKLAGMSRNKVNEGLRILRKIEELPEVKKVMENKGIWAVKPILRVVTHENESFWAEKAMTMSRITLETYVREIEKVDSAFGRPGAGNPVDLGLDKPHVFPEQEIAEKNLSTTKTCKVAVTMKLTEEVVAELEKLKGTQEWNALMLELLESHGKLAAHELAELEGNKPEKVRTSSRHIPIAIQRYVRARARRKCESPGCTRAGKHFHHTTDLPSGKNMIPTKLDYFVRSITVFIIMA